MDPLAQWSSEDEVFSHLLQGGQYVGAVALAHACWSGADLTAALERALAGLAAHCARLQTSEHGERRDSNHEGASSFQLTIGVSICWSVHLRH